MQTTCRIIVNDTLLALVGLVHGGVLLLSEDVAGIFAIHLIVADMVDNDCGFLLHDEPRHLADELLGIDLVEVKVNPYQVIQSICADFSEGKKRTAAALRRRPHMPPPHVTPCMSRHYLRSSTS